MGFIHPLGVLMLPSGLWPLGSIKTPLGWIEPVIPCDAVEQYLKTLFGYLAIKMTSGTFPADGGGEHEGPDDVTRWTILWQAGRSSRGLPTTEGVEMLLDWHRLRRRRHQIFHFTVTLSPCLGQLCTRVHLKRSVVCIYYNTIGSPTHLG